MKGKSCFELRQEFEKKVKELQEKCSHKNKSWMEEHWTIGHYTSYEILLCAFCEKILDRRPKPKPKKQQLKRLKR